MGRKAIPENIPIFLSAESFDRLIDDATSVIRWNPTLAIKLMDAAYVKGYSPIQIKAWNRAAKKINNTIRSIESQIFYNEKLYWQDTKPTKLKIIEEDLQMEDYIAMQQYSR